MKDMVGVRIITYYLDDCSRVADLLNREFAIDSENSMDKADGLASDQFGYRSAHYVATLRPSRSGLIEWHAYSGISVEFQVRTSLQHSWAAVSHKLQYKAADEAPALMRRRLYRLSALFELADEQFAALRDERAEAFSLYSNVVSIGRLDDVPIDTSSLAAYWSLSDKGRRFQEQLELHGFRTQDEEPMDEDRLVKDRFDLVRVLRECGLNTLAELDKYLSNSRLPRILKGLAADEPKDGTEALTRTSTDDALTQVLIIDMDRIDSLSADIYDPHVLPRLRAARDRFIGLGLIAGTGG